jgi:hypothetical protein
MSLPRSIISPLFWVENSSGVEGQQGVGHAHNKERKATMYRRRGLKRTLQQDHFVREKAM